MEIVRAPRPANHFTMIRNDVLRDQALSFKARGVLAYVLSLPDGESITANSLSGKAKEGRRAILSAFAELEEAGYMQIARTADKRGKWRTVTVITDVPHLDRATADRGGYRSESTEVRFCTHEPKCTSTEVRFCTSTEVPKPHPYIEDIPVEKTMSAESAQSSAQTPVDNSVDNSVRREAERITSAAWDAYKATRGKPPVWSYVGVRRLVQQQLTSGAASAEELEAALVTLDAVTINTLAIALANRRTTLVDPHEVSRLRQEQHAARIRQQYEAEYGTA